MKAQELIEKLEPYADFDLDVKIHLAVMEEELQKRFYKYPHDSYKAELSIDDIGYSDKVVCIGVTPADNQYQKRKASVGLLTRAVRCFINLVKVIMHNMHYNVEC